MYFVNLFDGEYQMIIKSGNGFWIFEGCDIINVIVVGNIVQDVEVIFYYLVRDVQMILEGNKVNVFFKVEKVVGGGIDWVFFMLSIIQFVNDVEYNVDCYDEIDNLDVYDEIGKLYIFVIRDYMDNSMF